MNRLFQLVLCLLVGAIAIPATVYAGSAADQQLNMVSGLSNKEKKDLAKQAGMDITGSQTTGSDQSVSQIPPATVEAFNIELLTEPSPIETSMFKRLSHYSGFINNDKQQRGTSDKQQRGTSDKQQTRTSDKQQTRTSDKQQRGTSDKQQRGTSGKQQTENENEFLNNDNRLQSAWGDKLTRTTQRQVNLSDRKRLQTAWNEQLNEQVTKVKVSNELLQYGYNLFAGTPTTFAAATEIPIPPEYVLGPGDELSIQLYGSRDDTLELVVDREGVIELPSVGPLNVAGQDFMQVKALISEKIHQNIIGATVSVSMGRLRSMRVFVLGDVNQPGSYLVSGLSTISNALFVSGGVSKQGSLRHILLKRSGKNVAELDLYDFLLKGDSRHDLRLQPGDVVFVPPIGKVIGVAGEVVRPGIYELKKGRSYRTDDILKLAGGSLASADIQHVQVDRISSAGISSLIDLDLSDEKGAVVGNGDLVLIYPVPGVKVDLVHLEGHVKRPGAFGLKRNMHLSDLIGSGSDLLPSVFLDYLVIQRANPVTGEITLLQPSLGEMLRDGYKTENPELHPGDKVFVLSNRAMNPLDSVTVQGAVQMPGEYPLGSGMRISDLFLIAGGPKGEAYLKEAELTRYEVINGERRISSHTSIDLTKALAGNADENIVLTADDVLMVRSISNWRPYEQVELKGEVKFPGTYAIEEGETIEALLERAGGLTDQAYVQAAVFTRESIRIMQKEMMDKAILKLESELAKKELDNSDINKAASLGGQTVNFSNVESALDKMREVEPLGRLLIDLDRKGKLRGGANLKLTDGDLLFIPKRPDQILVMGEVYNESPMLYYKNLNRDDYLDLAGGVTDVADDDNIYIVRANGYVDSSRGWNRNYEIFPGDTIVVPLNVDTFNLLDATLNWSKVLMQVGIFTASMVTVGIL